MKLNLPDNFRMKFTTFFSIVINSNWQMNLNWKFYPNTDTIRDLNKKTKATLFEALPFMMLSNHSFPFVLLICEVKTHSNTTQRDCWLCAHFSGAGVCRNQNTTRKIILRNIMKALLIDRWLNATNNDWIYELHFMHNSMNCRSFVESAALMCIVRACVNSMLFSTFLVSI